MKSFGTNSTQVSSTWNSTYTNEIHVKDTWIPFSSFFSSFSFSLTLILSTKLFWYQKMKSGKKGPEEQKGSYQKVRSTSLFQFASYMFMLNERQKFKLNLPIKDLSSSLCSLLSLLSLVSVCWRSTVSVLEKYCFSMLWL